MHIPDASAILVHKIIDWENMFHSKKQRAANDNPEKKLIIL